MMTRTSLFLTVMAVLSGVLVVGCGGEGGSEKSKSRLVAGGISDEARAAVPAQTACPVCGAAITRDAYVDAEKGRVYFDSEDCVQKWRDNPDKHRANLDDQKQPSPFGGGQKR